MFRKTHSNPKKAVFTEISKEFSIYFVRLDDLVRNVCKKYPRLVFCSMLCCIVASGILAFTVMRIKNVQPLSVPTTTITPFTDGFGQIIDAGQSLKKVLNLQNKINVILHKDSLTAGDSLAVENAINELQILNRQLNIK